MEIIIALVIIGVGLIWYFNAKKKDEANLPTAEPVKPATVNAADLAVKEDKPLLTIPVMDGASAGGVFNPVSLPVSVAPVELKPLPDLVEASAAPAKKTKARKAAPKLNPLPTLPGQAAPAKKTAAKKKAPAKKAGAKKKSA